MKLEFSAGGVIYKQEDNQIQFGLILDQFNKWTFPKGHIEKGEKPEKAALREVGEEVGISNLKIVNQLEKIDYWFKQNSELIHKYVYFYLIEATAQSEFRPQTEEVQEARWFSPQEAVKVLGYKKDNARLLAEAFEFLQIPLPQELEAIAKNRVE